MSKTRQAHIKVTLQFTVTIDEASIPVGTDKDDREYNERQLRLLQAVLSDDERRQAYLRYCIASRLELLSWRDWYDVVMGDESGDAKKILDPSIATLSQDDQEFFQGAEEHDVFFENVEKMTDCFVTELERVDLDVVEDER